MKKFLLFIALLLMLVGNSVQVTWADETEPEPTPTLFELNAQRNSNTQTKTGLEESVKRNEADLSRMRTEYKALAENAPNRGELADMISLQERLINEAKTEITTLNKSLQTLSTQIENNSETKINNITDRYNALIASIKNKGDEIDEKISKCTGDCEILEILELQKEANEAYLAYKRSEKEFEICEIDPGLCGTPLTELAEYVQEDAQKVRELLAELTRIETTRNTERKFNVSGIFTPTGDKGKILTVQVVVNTLADWLITLVSSIAVTALIIGGFIMIISGGDETRLELGKTIFTYSLIGLLVTLLSFGIITFIQSLFYSDDIAIEETEDVPPATTPSVTTPSSISPPATPTPAGP